MSQEIWTDLNFRSASKITNLPAPASANEPARLADLNAAIEGLKSKDTVRASTQGNVNLAAPGATVDGITMAAGERFLARAQTTDSQNGIYIWNGAATPATRSTDASTYTELVNAIVPVAEGTDAGKTYRQTGATGTIDVTAVTFISFGTGASAASESVAGIAELATQGETDTGTDDARIVTPLKLANWSGKAKKYQTNVGDGSATQYTVTHNLNSRDVHVQVVRVASPYDTVITDVERDTVNSVIVRFATAPTSNQFRVLVMG